MSSLFKFVADAYALPSILNGKIKFTPISELNDPSELLPNVITEEVTQSLERLRSVGYSDDDMEYLRRQGAVLQRLAPQFQAVSVPRTKEDATDLIRSSFFDNLPRLYGLLEQAAEEISSKVGLFCLTKRNDSLPMWAHYAANATGLVVEFSDLPACFQGDETGVLAQPVPVRYERERTGVTFDPRSHDSIFFSKFTDWQYEEELRVVLPLSQCHLVLEGDKRLYLYEIPPHYISRIILGWRMPENVGKLVGEIVRSTKPDTEIIQAKIEKGNICCGQRPYPGG